MAKRGRLIIFHTNRGPLTLDYVSAEDADRVFKAFRDKTEFFIRYGSHDPQHTYGTYYLDNISGLGYEPEFEEPKQ